MSSNKGGNGAVFGQAMRKSNKGSRYQRQFGGSSRASTVQDDMQRAAARRRQKIAINSKVDQAFQVEKFQLSSNADASTTTTKRGWLYNILPTSVCGFFCVDLLFCLAL